MKTDLMNEKVFLRKLNRNNKTININIPYQIIKQSGLKPSDYMKVTYRDDQNKITLSKININTDYGEDPK